MCSTAGASVSTLGKIMGKFVFSQKGQKYGPFFLSKWENFGKNAQFAHDFPSAKAPKHAVIVLLIIMTIVQFMIDNCVLH